MSVKQVILVVEDSPEDYVLIFRALQQAGVVNPIAHCSDGDEALDYLHDTLVPAGGSAAHRPALVLLDLNLPGTDGREVLEAIRRQPDLACVPVIVLTTSMHPQDIERCYALGANTYINKPATVAGFSETFESLKHWWFEVAILPRAAT